MANRVIKEAVHDPFIKNVESFLPNMAYRLSDFKVFPDVSTRTNWAAIATDLTVRLSGTHPDVDWSRLLSMPGTRCTPYGSVSDAIQWKPSKEVKWAVKASATLSALGREVTNVSLKRQANTSHPFYTTNLMLKKNAMLQSFTFIHDILDLIHKKDLDGLYAFDIPYTFGGHSKYRSQCDSFLSLTIRNGKIVAWQFKPRTATNWDGVAVSQDKSLRLANFPYISAKRMRGVYPCENASNSIGIAFHSMVLRGQLKKCDIFHYSLPEDITRRCDKIKNHHIYTKDESNWDMHFIRPLYELCLEGYEDAGLSHDFRILLELINYGPRVVFKDSNPVDDFKYTYDPLLLFELYKLIDHGMCSGNAGVADMNKDTVSSIDFAALVESGVLRRSWTNLFRFRDNQLYWQVHQNQGDNGFFDWADDTIASSYKKGRDICGYPVEFDDRLDFAGNTPVLESGMVRFYPRLDNLIANIWSPEFPITSNRNRNWIFGAWDRMVRHYSKNPASKEIWEIFNRVLVEHGCASVDDRTRNATFERPLGVLLDNLVDVEVAMNPDSIHYKVDKSQVHADLMDHYFINFDDEYVDKFNDDIFSKPELDKGEILSYCLERDREEGLYGKSDAA